MKSPITPTVEAIDDLQDCVEYWARRCEKAEAEIKNLLMHKQQYEEENRRLRNELSIARLNEGRALVLDHERGKQ